MRKQNLLKLIGILVILLQGIAFPVYYPPPPDSTQPPSSPSNGLKVNLERVRYCNNSLCLGGTTPYKFRFWEENNVDRDDQRKTYIANLSDPPTASVRNVVVFFAGQQGTDLVAGGGVPNVVTGQKKGYRSTWPSTQPSGYTWLDEKSLAVRVYNSGMFDMKNTFFAVVCDTAHYFASSTKDKAPGVITDLIRCFTIPTEGIRQIVPPLVSEHPANIPARFKFILKIQMPSCFYRIIYHWF